MQTRSFVARLAGPLLLALAASPAAAQPDPSIEGRLQEYLDSLHAAGSFPGVTVGVAFADGWSVALAAGQADTARDSPMTPDAGMLAGSVGKTFFAALALELVRDGRLTLDAHISSWFGDQDWFDRLPNATDITVRQLMNHTSGLVRYEFNPEFMAAVTATPYRVWQPDEQIEFLLDTEAPFPAGGGWTYSDTNYILLAMLMERITGENAYAAIRRRFVEPFELTDTYPSDRPRLPGLVQGYAGPDNPFGGADAVITGDSLAFNPQFEWGGGGFVSSARDLARWALELWGGPVIAPELRDEVFQGVEARGLGQNARYGLGVIIRDGPLGTSYGHSGFFPGYLTEMRYWPDAGFAVALQVNTSAGRPFGQTGPAAVLQRLATIIAESRGAS